MTTVEIKEKQPTDSQTNEEETEGTDKENIKKLNDENEDLKIDLKKKTDVIGDGPRNDKIFNDVSDLVHLAFSVHLDFCIYIWFGLQRRLKENEILQVCKKNIAGRPQTVQKGHRYGKFYSQNFIINCLVMLKEHFDLANRVGRQIETKPLDQLTEKLEESLLKVGQSRLYSMLSICDSILSMDGTPVFSASQQWVTDIYSMGNIVYIYHSLSQIKFPCSIYIT